MILKYVFFTINLLLFCLGFVITSIGIWVLVDKGIGHYGIKEPFTSTSLLYSVSYIVITFGLVLLIIGLIGCCGVFMEITCLLCCFAGILIIPIFLAAAALGVAIYAAKNEDVRLMVMDELYDIWPKSDIFNQIELNLECCGVSGQRDYKSNIPDSCIDVVTGSIHQYGCIDKLFYILTKMAGAIIGLSTTIIVLSVVSIILAILIKRSMRNSTKGVI